MLINYKIYLLNHRNVRKHTILQYYYLSIKSFIENKKTLHIQKEPNSALKISFSSSFNKFKSITLKRVDFLNGLSLMNANNPSILLFEEIDSNLPFTIRKT